MAGDLAAAPLAAARHNADDPGEVQTQWRMTSSQMPTRNYSVEDAARHRTEGASFADVSGRQPMSSASSALPSGRDFVAAGRGSSMRQSQGSAADRVGGLQPGLLSPGVARPVSSLASVPPAEAVEESRLTRDAATIGSAQGLPAPPPPTARHVNRMREVASGLSDQTTRMHHAARASDGGTGSSPQRTRMNRAADTIDSQESAETAAPSLQTASGAVSAPMPATLPVPIAPVSRGTTRHGSRFEYSSWEDARAANGEAEFLANSTHFTDASEPGRGSTANVPPNRAKAGVRRPAIVPQPPSTVPVHGVLGDIAGRDSEHRDPATPPPTAAGSTDPTPAAVRILPAAEAPGSQGQSLRVQDYSTYSTQATPGGMERRADDTRPQGSPQPESRAVPLSPQRNRLMNSRQNRGAVGIAARSQASVEPNPTVDLRQSLSGAATSGYPLVLGDVSQKLEYEPDDVGSDPDLVRHAVNLLRENTRESQGLRSPLQPTRLVNSTQNRAGVAGIAVGSLARVPNLMPANQAVGHSMPIPTAVPKSADDPTGQDSRLEQRSSPAVASVKPDQDREYRPDDAGPDRGSHVVNLPGRGTTDSRYLQSPLQPTGKVNSPQSRSGVAARSFASVQPIAHADLRPSASPTATYTVDVGVSVDDVAWNSAAIDHVPANPGLTGPSIPIPALPTPADDPTGQDARLEQYSFPALALGRTEPDRGQEYQPDDIGPDRQADDAAAPAKPRVMRAAEPALGWQHVGRTDGIKRPEGPRNTPALSLQSAAASHLRGAGTVGTTGASPERLGLRSSLQRSRLVTSPQNHAGVAGAARSPVGSQPNAPADLRQPASTAAAGVSAVSTGGHQERRRRIRSPGSPGNPVSRIPSNGASSHAGNAIERPGTSSSSPASTPAADGGYLVDGTEARSSRSSPVAFSAPSRQGARNSSGQSGSLHKGSGTNTETSNATRGDGAPVSTGCYVSLPENTRPNLALRKKAAGGPAARRAVAERPVPSSPIRPEVASEVQDASHDEEASAPGNSAAEDRAEQRSSQVAPGDSGAGRSEPRPVTAFFEVECSETAPEEAVFLVLAHSSGGAWNINSGTMLETSPERFPCWSTAVPISVDAFSKIEFQFAISDRSLSQPPRFECLNCRRLPQTEGQDGQAYEIVYRGAWEDSRNTVTVRPSTLSPLSPVGPEAQAGGMAVPAEPTARTAIMEGKGGPGHQSPGQFPVAADSTRRSRSLPETAFLGPEISQIPVVIVSSEILPWSNSGGLGRVTASLARQFALRGHRTLAISPMYTKPPPEDEFTYLGSAWVRLDQMDHEVRCMHKFISLGDGKGCDYVLLDHGCYQHRPNGLYCDSKTGQDYGDNLYRFAMLSLCALEVPLRLKFNRVAYGQKVAFISNDWQAALVSVFLAHRYRRNGLYRDARNIHIIHNLGFQGKFSSRRSSVSTLLGLGKAAALDLAKDGDLNLCKGAILCSDRVVTVSRNYAIEIQTTQGGFGLDGFLAQK
ncbi:SS1, partial [Symbiodinium sp. CCMP2456]